MAQPSQMLPSKEAALFRQLVKLYESKQYKKAIKSADQILKKFPDHGETLAMKVSTVCDGGWVLLQVLQPGEWHAFLASCIELPCRRCIPLNTSV